jgi:uncharacterized protein YggE
MSERLDGLQVVGHGKVSAVPDLVYVTVASNAHAASVAEANGQATAAMRAMLQAAAEAGIGERDRQTLSVSVRSAVEELQVATGYNASQQLLLRVRDVATAGDVVQRVLEAADDSARLHGMHLSVADPGPYVDEARILAMADARHRAEELARLAGRELGQVVSVNEGGRMVPYQREYARGVSLSMPVESGELDVILDLAVEFAWA